MSVKVLGAAWEESQAVGADLLVLLAMADWCNHSGICYPSYGQIARKARVSRTSVTSAIRRLIALGELERVTRGHAPTAGEEDVPRSIERQRRNRYRVLLPKRGKASEVGHSPAYPVGPEVGQSTDPSLLTEPSVKPSGSRGEATASVLTLVPERAGAPRRDRPVENPEENIGVITKLAHQVLDLRADTPEVELGEVVEAVKVHCASLDIASRSDVVLSAINSALVQRRRANKPPFLVGTAGDCAAKQQRPAWRRDDDGSP